MKLAMLALYDRKVEEFMTPFFAQTTGAAVRSLSDLVNGRGQERGQETPAVHPEDFSLYQFGWWVSGGVFDLLTKPELVCECANLKSAEG